MKIRIRFEKTGSIRYVGHLDFMRTFQKIIKKSGLAAIFTSGFNPHLLLSFADPLGVGEESTGEYADVEFAYRDRAPLTEHELSRLRDIGLDNDALPDPPEKEEFLRALNACAPEGVRFTDAVRVGLIRGSKAMALVRYAGWKIVPADSFFGACDADRLLTAFMARESIIVHKVTKKSEKDVDIRPQILDFRALLPEEYPDFVAGPGYTCRRGFSLTCLCGSAGNLKPQTVMEALAESAGISAEPHAFRIVRTELYDEQLRPLPAGGSAF